MPLRHTLGYRDMIVTVVFHESRWSGGSFLSLEACSTSIKQVPNQGSGNLAEEDEESLLKLEGWGVCCEILYPRTFKSYICKNLTHESLNMSFIKVISTDVLK